jgi:hypothetical protein
MHKTEWYMKCFLYRLMSLTLLCFTGCDGNTDNLGTEGSVDVSCRG